MHHSENVEHEIYQHLVYASEIDLNFDSAWGFCGTGKVALDKF